MTGYVKRPSVELVSNWCATRGLVKKHVFWYFFVTRDFPDFACAPYF
jgi:hypothetical protein